MKYLGSLLLQIIPVMIGVYLGFLVTDCSSEKQTNEKRNALVKNISAELTSNKNRLEQVVDYHRMVRDSVRYYLQHPKPISGPGFFRGTNTMTLPRSAFETGIQTGIINELSIDKIQALNTTYTHQDSYNEFGMLMLQGLITMDFDESKESIEKIFRYLSISMTDVVIKEEDLLKQYDKTLSLLNSKEK
ncbi:hypothetical protein MG296_11865 [Flavobacteriaceae bacterium TK19130]|nr:hypothetical protein [Thermobacterium salinum]